jgi:hypothetical protein
MAAPLKWSTLLQAAIWLSKKTNEEWTPEEIIDFASKKCCQDDIVNDFKFPTYLRTVIPDNLRDLLASVSLCKNNDYIFPAFICESVCVDGKSIPTTFLFNDNLVELKTYKNSAILFVSSHDPHNKQLPAKNDGSLQLAKKNRKPIIVYCVLHQYFHDLNEEYNFPLLSPIQINLETIGIRDAELKQLLRDYLDNPKQVPSKDKQLRLDQQDKNDFKNIARNLWEKNPNLTIEAVKNHPSAEYYKKTYTGRNTLRDWAREVDPREGDKRGRPKKSK